MKKLMVMLAAVALVSAVQAATALWGFSAYGMADAAPNTTYSGTAYVYTTDTIGQQALYDAFVADTAYDFSKTANASITLKDGFVNTEYGTDGELIYFGENTGTYSFYFVVVKDSSIYFSNVREDQTADSSGGIKNVRFYAQSDGMTTFSHFPAVAGFQGEGKWSAVPEPTSALLMLLGLAGLALKRKQA